MARCWSCGAQIRGGLHPRYWFTCPNCAQVEEIESLRSEASGNLRELAKIQEHGFETLSNRLSEAANIVEWGFEEVKWELQQQTNVLRSIDHTLRTPSETQANEWRRMAEELRRRGILDKSEGLFLQALDMNLLDYRTYVGLALTYLRMNQFDKARSLLEKSLPHAPRLLAQEHRGTRMDRKEDEGYEFAVEETPIVELTLEDLDDIFGHRRPKTKGQRFLDYKSYSYRLIGHIYFCEENYQQAASALKTAIELSPDYHLGYYDYAQYCSLDDKKEQCLVSLQKAISGDPFYFYLAQKEGAFDSLRHDVQMLLNKIRLEVSKVAELAISRAEKAVEEAREASPRAIENMREEQLALGSEKVYKKLKAKVKELQVAPAEVLALWHLYGDIYEILDEARKSVYPLQSELYTNFGSVFSQIQTKWKGIFDRASEAIGGIDVLYGFRGDKKFKYYIEKNLSREFSEFNQLAKQLSNKLEQCLEKPARLIFDYDSIYEDAKSQLDIAKSKLALGDYIAILEVDEIATAAQCLAKKAENEAYNERARMNARKLI